MDFCSYFSCVRFQRRSGQAWKSWKCISEKLFTHQSSLQVFANYWSFIRSDITLCCCQNSLFHFFLGEIDFSPLAVAYELGEWCHFGEPRLDSFLSFFPQDDEEDSSTSLLGQKKPGYHAPVAILNAIPQSDEQVRDYLLGSDFYTSFHQYTLASKILCGARVSFLIVKWSRIKLNLYLKLET